MRCGWAFPAIPAGATHWQLSVDGAVKPLVPVSTTTYWITGLANGSRLLGGAWLRRTVSSTSSSSVSVIGPATTGIAVPMTTPWKPSLQMNRHHSQKGEAAAPVAGRRHWLAAEIVGSETRALPLVRLRSPVLRAHPGDGKSRGHCRPPPGIGTGNRASRCPRRARGSPRSRPRVRWTRPVVGSRSLVTETLPKALPAGASRRPSARQRLVRRPPPFSVPHVPEAARGPERHEASLWTVVGVPGRTGAPRPGPNSVRGR